MNVPQCYVIRTIKFEKGYVTEKVCLFLIFVVELLKSGLRCLNLKKCRTTGITLSALKNLHEKLRVGVTLLLLVLTHLGSCYFLSGTGNL